MERKPRQVYTPPEPTEEAEQPRTTIGLQIKQEEEAKAAEAIEEALAEAACAAQLPDLCSAAEDDRNGQPLTFAPTMTLEAKLIDLGIDPEALRDFCRAAIRTPAELPIDPWESYDTIRQHAVGFAQELKKCGAKTYHIRLALEGAIKSLEGTEDKERRANYESGSEEEADQQQGSVEGDGQEEPTEATQGAEREA